MNINKALLAYVAYLPKENAILVSFRGTENFFNMVVDL